MESDGRGLRIAKDDAVAGAAPGMPEGRAWEVKFPPSKKFPAGSSRLYDNRKAAAEAVALAATRCGDQGVLAQLLEQNEEVIAWPPGYSPPHWMIEARETIDTMRATLPPADPLPEPEPAPVEAEAVAEPDGIEYVMASENIGASAAAKIADYAQRLRDAEDYGAALRIMDEEPSQKLMAWLKAKPASRTLAALESITREKAAAEVQA
jgi:hypothetical protein